MKTLTKIWKIADGNKTIIGLAGLQLMQLDLAVWGQISPDIITVAKWVFGALAAGGFILHVSKGKFTTTAN